MSGVEGFSHGEDSDDSFLRFGNRKTIRAVCGFELCTMWDFALSQGLPLSHVALAAMYLRNGGSIDYIACVARQFPLGIKGLSTTNVYRIIANVFAKTPKERYYKPEERFNVGLEDWECISGIVDGVPVYCRGNASLYNKKNQSKTVTFQVVVDLSGRPIGWSGGEQGNRNDAYAFNGWVPFPHRSNEYLLGDLIYSANAHCICAEKMKRGVHTEGQSRFDIFHRKLRARIEHTFAMMDFYRWLTFTELKATTIPAAFNFNMHLLSREMFHVKPNRYKDNLVNVPGDLGAPDCDCGCISFKSTPRPTTDHRNKLAAIFFSKPLPENKRSRKCSCKKSPTYTPRTKAQIKVKQKEIRDQIRLVTRLSLKAKKYR